MGINNIFMNYKTNDADKIKIDKNWLSGEGLKFIQTSTKWSKKHAKLFMYYLISLAEKFRSQHNKSIQSLQYHKLRRQTEETVEEWMGRLKILVVEFKYKEAGG